MNSIGDLDESFWLALEEVRRQAVNVEGLERHVAFRVEIGVKRQSGGNAIQQLDAADFDQAVGLSGIKTGGFGIENDFALLLSNPSFGTVEAATRSSRSVASGLWILRYRLGRSRGTPATHLPFYALWPESTAWCRAA